MFNRLIKGINVTPTFVWKHRFLPTRQPIPKPKPKNKTGLNKPKN